LGSADHDIYCVIGSQQPTVGTVRCGDLTALLYYG
jgi:hypothetical protein